MRRLREFTARLVEADVSVVTNAEQLAIYAAPILNFAFISCTHRFHVGSKAVGDNGVVRLDGDVVKQVLLHKAPVALRMVWRKSLVLVEVCRTDTAEINFASLLAGDQLTVQGQRGRAGSKANDTRRLLMDNGLKLVGGNLAHFLRGFYFDDVEMKHFLSPLSFIRLKFMLAVNPLLSDTHCTAAGRVPHPPQLSGSVPRTG